MTKRPLILVTNDDGITAPGIRTLITVMKELGDVVVVAPDRPQSGMGHAVTLDAPLYCDKVIIDTDVLGEYQFSGTPADCVKFAVSSLLDRKPDLCVSGINHGSNSSINVIYSGTMSAAIEGGIEGIPSIGFSLLDYSWDANFEPLKEDIKNITQKVLNQGLPKDIILNVNFPNIPLFKGIKICRQARANWQEKFDERTTPRGKKYYWLEGDFVNEDLEDDTDEWALKNDYISVVPVQFDMTAYKAMDTLERMNF